MAQKFVKTGVGPNSSKNYMIGAGIIGHHFTWKPGSSGGQGSYTFIKFGATSGGSPLTLNTTLTQLEIDGILSTPAGGDIIESTEGTLEANMAEATLDNIRMAVIGEMRKGDGKTLPTTLEYVRPKGIVEMRDYIPNLVHFTPTGDGGALVVVFDYAIVSEGLELDPQQGETNVMTATFQARTNPNNLDDASLPVRIFRMTKEELLTITMYEPGETPGA